jgi:hypothetical protein
LASRRGIAASELVLELVEKEMQAERQTKHPTAAALRKLRRDARSAYLREAARKASSARAEYEIVEDVTDIIEY